MQAAGCFSLHLWCTERERERDSLAFTYHSDLESWLVSLANNPVSWYRMYNFCKPCFWNVFEKVKSWSYLTSHSRFTMFYPHFAEGLVSCCWSARSWGDRLMWGLKAFHHTDSFCVATDQEKHWKKLKPFGRSIHNFAPAGRNRNMGSGISEALLWCTRLWFKHACRLIVEPKLPQLLSLWIMLGDLCRRPFNAAICEQTSSAVPAASPARHGYQARVFSSWWILSNYVKLTT